MLTLSTTNSMVSPYWVFDYSLFAFKEDLSLWPTIALAFKTLGVVYGDMGTSPLYVFIDVFSKVPIVSNDDILGALSLSSKQMTVEKVRDSLSPSELFCFGSSPYINGSTVGGMFALYSLICRYANVGLLPNLQQADEHISSFKVKLPTPEMERALKIKDTLERISFLRNLLLELVILGASMVIGNGILTPKYQVDIDFEKEPIGIGKDGNNVYVRDIWPSTQEIVEVNNV
ncbi:hypothetical protein JHK87_045122 [Glycine soja]|nr:hypothetical protein JHK87_045122 [Glycine soja]